MGKVTSVSVSFECVNSRFDDRILENKTGCCNARILFIFCILLYESIRFNTMKIVIQVIKIVMENL